jgi:hypothetical protein
MSIAFHQAAKKLCWHLSIWNFHRSLGVEHGKADVAALRIRANRQRGANSGGLRAEAFARSTG